MLGDLKSARIITAGVVPAFFLRYNRDIGNDMLILILNKNLYHLLRYISYSFVGLLDRRQPVCVSRRAIRNISLISD